MIQVLNNILYYLNLVATLHAQQDIISSQNGTNITDNLNSTISSLPVLVKQIPPGPIAPGVVIKFVCSVDNDSSSCITTSIPTDEVSYQWEMLQYTEDKDGRVDNTSLVKLPVNNAEMEMKFNESLADPSLHCDLVCTITNNPQPSSASIKLHFLNKDDNGISAKVLPPSGFRMLEVTSKAVYFSWNPPNYIQSRGADKTTGYLRSPQITGYVIEYKNGKGTPDWKFEKISRYEIKNGSTFAACISNLSPWTTYHFRIVSRTKHNVSAPSLPIIVRTLEEVPTAPPQDIKMIVTEEKALEVSWKPPPRINWNGALLGYNVGLKKASSADNEPYDIYVLHPLETLGNLHVYKMTVSDASVRYKVVVQAFNNIGVGPFSEPVTQQEANTEGE